MLLRSSGPIEARWPLWCFAFAHSKYVRLSLRLGVAFSRLYTRIGLTLHAAVAVSTRKTTRILPGIPSCGMHVSADWTGRVGSCVPEDCIPQ